MKMRRTGALDCNGRGCVIETPIPPLERGMVRVAVKASLISAGTELSTCKYIREHPEHKLPKPHPFGYQNAGIVTQVGEGVDEFAPGDRVVMFFDGSKTDDATALVACRIDDGAVFTLGVWQRPDHVEEWAVPRADVDAMVDRACSLYEVRAFFADPGGGKDEHAGEGERYWDAYVDRWSREHGDEFDLWATDGGKERHAVMWDMSSPLRQKLFTEAAGRALSDIEARQFIHDGHPVLRTHVVNARRRPNQWGVTITKEHRESKRKIDLAVCAIGARMVRRMWLALPERKRRRRKTGRVVIVP